jgi:hypothetical protein
MSRRTAQEAALDEQFKKEREAFGTWRHFCTAISAQQACCCGSKKKPKIRISFV